MRAVGSDTLSLKQVLDSRHKARGDDIACVANFAVG